MIKWSHLYALAGILALSAGACGPDASENSAAADETSGAESLADELASFDEADVFRPRASLATLSALPEAPWEGAPLSSASVPRGLVEAWRGAENRAWCTPLSLSALGIADATPRAVALEGGWALEFDAIGLPGVGASGEPCASCGRGVFGVAGTGMQIDEDESMEGAPTYRDGSNAQVASTQEGVASALISVHGQSCVYQVWSYLGEGHLESLLEGLRFVVVTSSGAEAQIADVRYK